MTKQPADVFQIEKIIKKYGDQTILDIGRLTIKRGLIYALIGPNGAGKSTLLRQLNLLDKPDHGEFQFLGNSLEVISKNKLEFQRKMTLVFQKPTLFDTNVWNNVAYGLKIRGFDKETIKNRVKETLEMVGLLEKSKQKALTLSGGEAQRLALARAIVLRPDVLLLDEPTASLDPRNGYEVEKLIQKINNEMGTAIIIVTHNMFQAKRIAHRVVFMSEGKIIEEGCTLDIMDQPKSQLTKAFVKGEIVF